MQIRQLGHRKAVWKNSQLQLIVPSGKINHVVGKKKIKLKNVRKQSQSKVSLEMTCYV